MWILNTKTLAINSRHPSIFHFLYTFLVVYMAQY